MSDAPLCRKCGNPCVWYSVEKRYSVHCEQCNAVINAKRRATPSYKKKIKSTRGGNMSKERPAPEFNRPQMAACFELESANAMGIEICLTTKGEIIIYEYNCIESSEGVMQNSLLDDKNVRYDIVDGDTAVYSKFMEFHNVKDFIARMRLAIDTFEKVSEIKWPDSQF